MCSSDLFGRRNMDVSYDELYADVLYQISALQGLAQIAGIKVTYVKPHGALYNTIATNLTQAQAVIDAIQHSDKKLVLVALAGSPLINFARKQGVGVISEAFADRAYHRNGELVSRRLEGAVLHDAEVVAQRVLSMIQNGGIESIEGDFTTIQADTICLHGDTFGAVQMAEKIRQVLLENTHPTDIIKIDTIKVSWSPDLAQSNLAKAKFPDKEWSGNADNGELVTLSGGATILGGQTNRELKIGRAHV